MAVVDIGPMSICYTIWLVLSSLGENGSQPDLFKTIVTKNGAVRGRLDTTFLQEEPYYAFKGIPYAKPPIGERRFKAPEPVESWAPRVLDATKYGSPCWMTAPNFKIDKPMSENCLFMNIYVPVVNTTSKLAVMLHIVGGGFKANSADDALAGPDFLIEHGIILVTFNYRLGPFGFMSLDTPEYSGNMGMKDQQMAIQWVYNNIEYFGGDNQKITLSGHSTGAFSVDFQVLNPESRKYFNQVIPMSGSALNFNAYHTGNHRCLMQAIAKNASQSVNTTKDLIGFVKRIPAWQIQSFIDNHNEELPELIPWAPIIERKDAIRPFITDTPINVYNQMQHFNITSFITFTDGEIMLYETPATLQPSSVDRHIQQLEFQLPIHGFDLSYTKKPYLRELLEEFRYYFFENATSDAEKADRYVIMKSYIIFVYGIEKMMQFHVAKSNRPTYYMRFSGRGTMRGFKGIDAYTTPVKRAAHAEDLCYTFKCNAYKFDYDYIARTKNTAPDTAITLKIIRNLTTLYTNFVKYGNPIQGHKPVRPHEINFLDVTNGGLFLGQWPNGINENFTDYIVAKAIQLMRENEKSPSMTAFERVCQKLKNQRV